MAKIFISYRRADSETIVGRIYDRLVARFGAEAIFKDVDSIPLGQDFKQYIGGMIRQCAVELVIIGPRWLDIKDARTGQRRLEDSKDNVRAEVESAIEANVLIIPLLVERATMPDIEHLPDSLQPLALRNGRPVRNDPDFNHDIGAVLAALEQYARGTGLELGTGADTGIGIGTGTGALTDSQAGLVRQMLPEIEHAYDARDWHAVADKSALLLRLAPGAAQFSLFRMRSHALLALGDSQGAVPLLQDALALASTPADRLDVLREYIPVLQALGRWGDMLARCDEALRLQTDDPGWLALRLDALMHLDRTHDVLAVAHQLAEHPQATVADWITFARLTAQSTHNNRAAIRSVMDEAAHRFPGDATLAAGRHELLPPVPRERFPERLERLGFVSAERDGAGFILPPLCPVPAGPFLMGSDPRQDRQAGDFERPQRQVTLAAYQISRFPVTVAEYACFVAAGHAPPQKGSNGLDWQMQLQRLDHPVTSVTWHDVSDYAAWLEKITGQPWKLPSEAEWEKAARWDISGNGGHGVARIYPWGDHFEASRCNTIESGIKTTTVLGSYGRGNLLRDGASPCGAQDMAGNVWEWTSTLSRPYPYSGSDGRENPNSSESRVVRGGSWYYDSRSARAACRGSSQPGGISGDIGFRLVLLSAG